MIITTLPQVTQVPQIHSLVRIENCFGNRGFLLKIYDALYTLLKFVRNILNYSVYNSKSLCQECGN